MALDAAAKQRLSAAIKKLRGDRTQRAFAEILEVSQATVQQWESGRGGDPSYDSIEKIAKLRGEYPEQFIAYLCDRTISTELSLEEQILNMDCQEIADLNVRVATAIAKTLRQLQHTKDDL